MYLWEQNYYYRNDFVWDIDDKIKINYIKTKFNNSKQFVHNIIKLVLITFKYKKYVLL